MSDRESSPERAEPVDGFESVLGDTTPTAPGSPEERPDWLVGADDGADFSTVERRKAMPVPRLVAPASAAGREPPAPAPPAAIPAAVPRPGRAGRSVPVEARWASAGAPTGEAADDAEPAWAAAASSVPTLSVVSSAREAREADALEEDLSSSPTPSAADPGEGAAEVVDGVESPAGPPREPWHLVAVETLATNRPLQAGLLAVLAVAAAWVLWPRKENQSTSIALIKQHPQTFEGRLVRVRGEVGDVFDVGGGVIFQLHQRRDTMVVFSPTRRPATHDKLAVVGTVSTGYLDGVPRVALFEAPGATP